MSATSSLPVERINAILGSIYAGTNNSLQEIVISIFARSLFGNTIVKIKQKRVRQKHIGLLDKLIEAFELGYVPGGIDGEPKEWQTTTLMLFFEKYHPENRAYFRELQPIIYERIKGNARVPAKGQSAHGYKAFMSVDALMDLEGLSPPMKHKLRRLEYGNTDKQYWISWANEIKKHIKQELQTIN